LNFKAVGAITVFPKKITNLKKRQKCERISFIYTEEKFGMQATRNYSLPSGQVAMAIPKISRYISASGTRNVVILWTLVDNFFYNFGVTFITNLKRVINLL
jgi:hypothetical protein